MTTKLLFLVVPVVLIIGAIVIVTSKPQQVSSPSTPPVIQQTKPSEQLATGEKRYVLYSKATLDQAANKRRVLYFYANWCPICRPIDVEFKQKETKIPQDVVVIRVNYNDSETSQEAKDLAKKYEVAYQHTFVQIDSQGNKIALWNGGGLTELLTNIQ